LTVVISAFRIANTTAITSRAKRGLVGCEDEEGVTSLVVVVIGYQLSGGEGLQWCM
jgi:hypothetical protein